MYWRVARTWELQKCKNKTTLHLVKNPPLKGKNSMYTLYSGVYQKLYSIDLYTHTNTHVHKINKHEYTFLPTQCARHINTRKKPAATRTCGNLMKIIIFFVCVFGKWIVCTLQVQTWQKMCILHLEKRKYLSSKSRCEGKKNYFLEHF